MYYDSVLSNSEFLKRENYVLNTFYYSLDISEFVKWETIFLLLYYHFFMMYECLKRETTFLIGWIIFELSETKKHLYVLMVVCSMFPLCLSLERGTILLRCSNTFALFRSFWNGRTILSFVFSYVLSISELFKRGDNISIIVLSSYHYFRVFETGKL